MLYLILFILPIISISIIISTPLQAKNIKNSAVVYMYHKFNIYKYPSTNIKLEQLENHLQELSKSKYNVISLEHIVDSIINDINLPENTIGISVDDADRSFLEVAWPLFKKFNFPVTLFVTTNTIANIKNNYLTWDEIRLIQNEGVTIGSHSYSHSHLANFTSNQLLEEIENSNKIFMKEIGKIPNLFAYPYGELDIKFINILKDYNFKAAFGQHSGVINETSEIYFLPRFSLNEKYGDIERIRFSANAKGLGIYDFIPNNPNISQNPPYIGFSLLDENLSTKINCFIFDKDGEVERDIFKFNERIEIRLNRKLKQGRSRLNCTAKDNNIWRWYGYQFYLNEN